MRFPNRTGLRQEITFAICIRNRAIGVNFRKELCAEYPRPVDAVSEPHRILRENLQLQRLLNSAVKQETDDRAGISPVRLGMQIANVKHSHCEANLVSACGKPNLGAYTAKPNLPGLEDGAVNNAI